MIRPLTAALAVTILFAMQVQLRGAEAKDILGTAQDAGTFTILLAAVRSAGLTEILMAPGHSRFLLQPTTPSPSSRAKSFKNY